jgi:F-type H+-transporting ATPase subunit b
MFQDPKFWLAVSFFIFLGFLIKVILPKVIIILKDKSDEISQKFDEIESLKNKAEKLLCESILIRENIEKEANKIISNANEEVKRIIVKAEEDLRTKIEYKLSLAEQKIDQEKEKIIRNTKMSIISLAIDEIKKTFEKDKVVSKNIEEESILHISKAIN